MRRGPAWTIVACVLAALLGLAWLATGEEQATATATATAAGAGGAVPGRGSDASAPPLSALGGGASLASLPRAQQLAIWQQRYDRAAQVYATYLDGTRYPPESRALADQPEAVRPFAPAVDEAPLRDADGKAAGAIRVRTMQDRTFLSGAEATRLMVDATDASGAPLPVSVRRAAAQWLPEGGAPMPAVRTDIVFRDDGTQGDEAAGDGRQTAVLAPAQQGIGARAGTIRVVAELAVGGSTGNVAFDVIYEPQVPAEWRGVREAMEDGALAFYLQARVQQPGRYVVTARVFDAEGQPLALLQANEEAGAGSAEFRLALAGLLVHDKRPAFPLQLVDVEGFLLKPDTFPDRAMLPRREGIVHTSRSYPLDVFSTREWIGEQRNRFLAEYARDVDRARQEIERLRR